MFNKFFRRPKKEKPAPQPHKRDFFKELFPLSDENRAAIDQAVGDLQQKMFGEEAFVKYRAYERKYTTTAATFGALKFDSLGWTKGEGDVYHNEYGDYMQLMTAKPNGEMAADRHKQQLPVYRNWLRDMTAKLGGGLIFCEATSSNGLAFYESIYKIPKDSGQGMDYTYFLNIPNYKEQLLYQVFVYLFEGNPTGLRDSLMMSALPKVIDVDMMELVQGYRKDPYNAKFEGGNRRNLSEMEDFDAFFPAHPLSVLRREVKPRLLSSLEFNVQ